LSDKKSHYRLIFIRPQHDRLPKGTPLWIPRHPDEQDREPCKYWWCLSCDWKSEIYYYPALQPELGLWEPTETPIEISQETYRELHELLHGLAADLPYNLKVKAALQRLETVKIIS
jgi:hypothetical protein